MFASTVIVFREVLEAALVLSIIAAATREVPGRSMWLTTGFLGGVLGAFLVATFASQIADALEGVGQEIFNATVLCVAVFMLGWHNIWMRKHGQELAADMTRVGKAASEGSRPLSALAIAVALAILREGSELVLFLYGIAGNGTSSSDMIMGSIAGVALGAAAGWALYAGLLALPVGRLFAVTGWMILLLAAGMAATAARFLSQADILPSLGNAIWDTSWLLAEDSVVGQIFHVMIGYVARPSGIQLVFYGATVAIIGGLMLALNPARRRLPQPAITAVATTLLALMVVTAASAPDAHAGFYVYTPYVEYNEVELEYRPSITLDSDVSKRNEQTHLVAIGYGVTDFWFTEVYGEWERKAGPDENTSFHALEWDNRFELTEPGEYWADIGLLLSYERSNSRGAADTIEAGLLLAKELGRFDAAINLRLSRQVGSQAIHDVELSQAFHLTYRQDEMFAPGFELFSEFGSVDDWVPGDQQKHYLGPVAEGDFTLDDKGTKLNYEIGYLFGLTDASADGVVKASIELEFPH